MAPNRPNPTAHAAGSSSAAKLLFPLFDRWFNATLRTMSASPVPLTATVSRRQLLRDWRLTLAILNVGVISPAPPLRLGPRMSFKADFYLPRSRQYVIVVDEFCHAHSIDYSIEHLIIAATAAAPARPFASPEPAPESSLPPDYPIIAACPGGALRGWHVVACDGSCMPMGMYQCSHCRGWWFLEESQSWQCQCCGFYDGNAGLLNNYSSPLRPFPITLPPIEVV
jgi:hypothetical protein